MTVLFGALIHLQHEFEISTRITIFNIFTNFCSATNTDIIFLSMSVMILKNFDFTIIGLIMILI